MDDHGFFSSCLRTLIEREEELAVCDVAADETDLPARIAQLRPDLLVLDLSVGRRGGYELAGALRAGGIDTPILFISSAHPMAPARLAAIRGAEFAPKGGNPQELIRTIRALVRRPVRAEARPVELALA